MNNQYEYFDNFDKRARIIMELTRKEARNFAHEYIGSEHLLAGIFREGKSMVSAIISEYTDLMEIREEIKKRGQKPIRLNSPNPPDVAYDFTPGMYGIIEKAKEYKNKEGQSEVNVFGLVYGLYSEEEGIGRAILIDSGLPPEQFASDLERRLAKLRHK